MLLLCLLATPVSAQISVAPRTSITFTQGSTSRSLPATANTKVSNAIVNGNTRYQVGGSWVQFPLSGGDVVTRWNLSTCPSKPAPLTRHADCPSGTSGDGWEQTADWTSAPAPTCWTLGRYLPTDPPEGACAALPPPSGGLNIDLSYVDTSSPQYAQFKSFVDAAVAGNPGYGFQATDAAYLYRITHDSRYATLAVTMADQQVAAAETAIASGRNPEVAGDSYYSSGDMIGDVAIVYAWCGDFMTATQRSRWSAYASQTVFNIWHPEQAAWGGRSAPWSGWAVNDPANNYYYKFLRATMFWALASDDSNLLDYLRTDRLQLLTSFMATVPGGGSLEGTGYGTSHMMLFELYQVWKDSGQGDLATLNTHLANSLRFWVAATMPTLDKFAPIGDQARVSEPQIYDYQRRLVVEGYHLTADAEAANEAAWWLNSIANGYADHGLMQNGFNSRFNLVPVASADAPSVLTFRAPEVGLTVGRTSWSTDATWFGVVMGLYDQSHAHQEQGGFTLYRNTWLAVTNNIWSHSGINQSTIDKNVIRFERNGVQPQRSCDTCKVNVTSYTTGPSGEFHITGDLTGMYASGAGVMRWIRTVDFVGGIATISDDVQTSSGTSATFQLNVPTQPTIIGNVITAGALKATVLNPDGAAISTLDMRTVNVPGYGNDYNAGWRVDVACNAGCRIELRAN
jgi:hypothetical protein